MTTNTLLNYYIAIILLLTCDLEKYFYFFNTVTDRGIYRMFINSYKYRYAYKGYTSEDNTYKDKYRYMLPINTTPIKVNILLPVNAVIFIALHLVVAVWGMGISL